MARCEPCGDQCDFACVSFAGGAALTLILIVIPTALGGHPVATTVLASIASALLISAFFTVLGRCLWGSTRCSSWCMRLGHVCTRCWCCGCYLTQEELEYHGLLDEEAMS